MADKRYGYDPISTDQVQQSNVHNTFNTMDQKNIKGQSWRQFIIAGIANIGILNTGYCMGWTSPIQAKLQDVTQSPLDVTVTDSEMSWVGSLVAMGAIFGPFIGGACASRFGRKNGGLFASVPLLIGWFLILFAQNVGMIYAGRIFWGLAVGILFTIVPMYAGEIATDDCRGALGSFLQLFVVVGFLIIYSIGPYVSYSVVAYIGIILTVVFDLLFFFMPESPSYYLTKDDRESAGKSLTTIRGLPRHSIEPELTKLTSNIQQATAHEAKLNDLWATRGNIKALYISFGLVTFQQLSGINVVLFYMSSIFEKAGSDLAPEIATIIIGAVQVLASSVTPFVVDRLGRRFLLILSATGMAIGLGLLGMYFILDTNESPIVQSISFLPVASLVIFICVYCVGFGPLPWAVMGELFPINIKAKAAPIATAFCWILGFIVTKFFSDIQNAIGMHFAFWIFAICCVVALVFTMFLVPETKGKSADEIQDMLEGKSKSTSKTMA